VHEAKGWFDSKAAHEAAESLKHHAKHQAGELSQQAKEIGQQAKENLKDLGRRMLPETLQEKLGINEESLGGKVLNFFERTVLGRPLVFVAFPLIIGLFISAWVHRQVRGNRGVFDKIALPRNVPPTWLYDPAWTVALACMGYASWLIYEQGGWGEWISLGFYNVCLFLLSAWPFLFFNNPTDLTQFFPALCATLLSINTIVTMGLFFAKNVTAGALMIPSVLWIGYMTLINWQVFSLNKQRGLSTGTTSASIKGKEETWPWSTSANAGATTVGSPGSTEAKKTR